MPEEKTEDDMEDNIHRTEDDLDRMNDNIHRTEVGSSPTSEEKASGRQRRQPESLYSRYEGK
jgi:hypothetical protein